MKMNTPTAKPFDNIDERALKAFEPVSTSLLGSSPNEKISKLEAGY